MTNLIKDRPKKTGKRCSVILSTFVLGLFVLVLSPLSFAVPISSAEYEFSLLFDEGPLSGQDFTGTFSVETPPDIPNGLYLRMGAESNPLPDGALLSFDIMIGNYTFSLDDFVNEEPYVVFENGEVTKIFYDGLVNPPFTLFCDGGCGSVVTGPAPVSFGDSSTGGQSTGNVTSIKQVPEPTTLALIGLGLAGIGGYRRRQLKEA